jgi:ANTAR domain
MRETGAAGYALDGYEQGSAFAVRLSADGLEVPRGEQEGLSVARLPLHVRDREVGCLAFIFRVAAIPKDTWRLLERFARMLESIWSLFDTPEKVIDLATRISRRQAELADLKIAERALGFLNHPQPGAAETMALHVESVLRARRFEAILDQFAGDIEDQLEDRKVIAKAKELLQATHGITEDEAYSQLRLSSRRSRRRISEVAEQLVKGRSNAQST